MSFSLSAESINSHFPFCPPQLKWSLTVLCLQGWLPRYSIDRLPVLWRRFHLCTEQNGEALQRQKEREGEKGEEEEEEGEGSSDRNAHQAWTVSGKWESVVPPSLSRCQSRGTPNYSRKFWTTASRLIIPDPSFRFFFFIAAPCAAFHLVCFALYLSFSCGCSCSLLNPQVFYLWYISVDFYSCICVRFSS